MAADELGNLFGVVLGTGLLLWTLGETERMFSYPSQSVHDNQRGLFSVF